MFWENATIVARVSSLKVAKWFTFLLNTINFPCFFIVFEKKFSVYNFQKLKGKHNSRNPTLSGSLFLKKSSQGESSQSRFLTYVTFCAFS